MFLAVNHVNGLVYGTVGGGGRVGVVLVEVVAGVLVVACDGGHEVVHSLQSWLVPKHRHCQSFFNWLDIFFQLIRLLLYSGSCSIESVGCLLRKVMLDFGTYVAVFVLKCR